MLLSLLLLLLSLLLLLLSLLLLWVQLAKAPLAVRIPINIFAAYQRKSMQRSTLIPPSLFWPRYREEREERERREEREKEE